MRNLNALFTLPLCLLVVSAHAQNQNAVKLNPLGALFGAPGVGFEHALSNHGSVQLNARFFTSSFDVSAVANPGTATANKKYSGFGLVPEYRHYCNVAMDGWYGGAFFNWNAITSKTTYSDNSNIGDSEVKITNVGGGIEFGRQWLLGAKDGFVIDLNIGVGYQSAIVDADGTNTDEDIQFGLAGTGIWPRLTFAIGYAF